MGRFFVCSDQKLIIIISIGRFFLMFCRLSVRFGHILNYARAFVIRGKEEGRRGEGGYNVTK